MIIKNVLIILGPTGTGKTRISLEYAEKLNGEVINIDSAQFYKSFKIGTGVIKNDEMRKIRHHFFATFEEKFEFSAYSYLEMVEKKIKEIIEKKKTPILVGGSHFYISSLFFKEKKEKGDFIKLNFKFYEIKEKSNDYLYELLMEVCPKRAEDINKNDRFRVLNSIKKIEKFGSFPEIVFEPKFKFEILEVKIDEDRKLYSEKLMKRIETFFSDGWIEEIKSLKKKEVDFLKRKKFIGYDLIIEEMEKKRIENFKKDEEYRKKLKEKILSRTIYYAKKQEQFIKKLKNELIKRNIVWREFGRKIYF